MPAPSPFQQQHRPVYLLDPSRRCEPSAYLFTRAVNFFLKNGYGLTSDIEKCGTILVNSCCVTGDKIDSTLAAIAIARANGKGKRIVLLGCIATLPLSRLDKTGLICIGPKNLDDLDQLFPHQTPLCNIDAGRLPPEFYQPGQGLSHDDYFVMISQGCSNNCTYCNIKRAKGSVRSEPPAAVLAQIRHGIAAGAEEFALLADDCASYGRDLGIDLVELLWKILAIGDSFRLKLGYLFPAFLLDHGEELVKILASGRISYLNIPLQSGSERILHLMNRHYGTGPVHEVLRRLKEASPGTTFCTHMMINFPTETYADFVATLAAADPFDEVIFLHYADNSGTAAGTLLPKVPPQEAERRLDLASHYANKRKLGHSAVIKDFNCERPYNLPGSGKR